MQYNLLKKRLEKISLELNDVINLLLDKKQNVSIIALKCLEDLEHILHVGKNILDVAAQKENNN